MILNQNIVYYPAKIVKSFVIKERSWINKCKIYVRIIC